MKSYTKTCRCWLSSKDLHTSAMYRHWIQPRGPARNDGHKEWKVRESQDSVPSAQLDDDDDVIKHLEINQISELNNP